VREQYEENPYPRWINLPPPGKALPIDGYLHQRFPLAPFRPLRKGADIDVLVAGCGTGAEPISAARELSDVQILAIDLSLSSLGYAMRKTAEFGIKNIQYAQADIVKVRSIGRTFDVILSGGVLHHLANPVAGLRELLAVLRPGGFMRLGLYSERARRAVVAARQFIAVQGYTPDAEDIRRCRQDLIAKGGQFESLAYAADFYSTSECRDLLFHVQEHRFTIPQIGRMLQDTGLKFIGFSIDPRILKKYAARYPADRAQMDLDHWNSFEEAFPDTFAAMYNFWVQKPAPS
jgi:SAM-dependent methyltransferase